MCFVPEIGINAVRNHVSDIRHLQKPLFVGGGDYALAPGSPALNAGDDSLAFGTEDLAGAARIVGAAVDLGAYELQVAVDSKVMIESSRPYSKMKKHVVVSIVK